jgi:hypothetical protein
MLQSVNGEDALNYYATHLTFTYPDTGTINTDASYPPKSQS